MEQTQFATHDKTGAYVTVPLAMAMLLASLGTSIANIALPALVEAFSSSFPKVQAVVVAYLAALTVAVVIAGRIGDRYGLRRALLAGLSLFASASLACSLAPDLWWLIAARALQGVGAAFLMVLSMALMRERVDEARMGRAMGLLGTMSALGTALGPSLGGIVLAFAGWRGIFGVQVLLAMIALLLAVSMIADDGGRKKSSGAGLLSVLNGAMIPGLLVNLVVAMVMMTTLVTGPFYLRIGLGLQETWAGLVMAIGPVISIASGAPSGRLVDAWGSRRVLTLGLCLVGAGAFSLAFLPNLIGVFGYVLAMAVLTPGYQLFQAANNTAVMADVPKDRRGTVSGLLALSRNTGLVLGASIMGTVFAFGVGTDRFASADAIAIGAGMRITFLVAGAMVVAAIAFDVFSGRNRGASAAVKTDGDHAGREQ